MAEVSAIPINYNQPGGHWPNLTPLMATCVYGAPVVGLLACYIWLRVIWPDKYTFPLSREQQALNNDTKGAKYGATLNKEGEERYSYDDYNWKEQFDAVFLGIMIVGFAALSIATTLVMPELWSNTTFWLLQLPKLAVMMFVSCLGGLLCRYMCDVDEKGYIQTGKVKVDAETGATQIVKKKSWFKVNYTRKLQHFAAYAVPLFIKSNVSGTLALCWGDWFTMLGFLVQIQPIRERSTFFMLQFNSLDRPEDRPDTLKLIIALNILPGLCCIILFRYLYSFTGQAELALIWIFITGVGDGLAEPVGITWGIHKYYSKGICMKKQPGQKLYFSRSLEGSCCVFLSGMVFTSVYYDGFANATQFWVCMILMPPALAYSEAVAPHTGDTAFLMIVGGLICLGCSYLPPLF